MRSQHDENNKTYLNLGCRGTVHDEGGENPCSSCPGSAQGKCQCLFCCCCNTLYIGLHCILSYKGNYLQCVDPAIFQQISVNHVYLL